MRIYLAVRPEHQREAAGFPAGLAHAAYRIGEDSVLLSRNLLRPAPCGGAGRSAAGKGLLVLSDEAAPPIRRPEALAGAVLRECGGGNTKAWFWILKSAPRRSGGALLRR